VTVRKETSVLIMPANSSGWFWHCLARETGKIGHLYSPRAQRGPWPWFPYALDNGAFSCWDSKNNTFDTDKWQKTEQPWRELLFWSQTNKQKPRWAIVPDVPGNAEATIEKWPRYANDVQENLIPLAIAVQDGMTPADVKALKPQPEIICVGGSTEFKWDTVEIWAKHFKRVHVLRVNAPGKLEYLRDLGIESCDGTGWNRGTQKQTAGLERYCRRFRGAYRCHHWLYFHTCKAPKQKEQLTFA